MSKATIGTHEQYDPNDAQMQSVECTDGAVHTAGPDGGSINGGMKVAGVNQAANDVFLDWLHGNDTTPNALTAEVADNGIFVDMSLLNTDHRSLVVVNGKTDGVGIDYSLAVYFGRSIDIADRYLVSFDASLTTAIKNLVLPATMGYDLFVQAVITPAASQSSTQLDFQVYLAGRGG